MNMKSTIAMLLVCGVAMTATACMEKSHEEPHARRETMNVSAERADVITRQGKPLTLIGATPKVGDAAPSFTAVANDMSTFTFKPGDSVTILSAVPSLDTP